jgi:hypothetical protein
MNCGTMTSATLSIHLSREMLQIAVSRLAARVRLVAWCFCFKAAQDGHKLVYPWGVFGGGGYVISSEQQYKLLRRHLKANAVIWLVLVGIATYIQVYLGPLDPLPTDFVDQLSILIVVSCFIAFDVIWRQYLVRGMQQSDERLSPKDKALVAGRVILLAIPGLALVSILAHALNR